LKFVVAPTEKKEYISGSVLTSAVPLFNAGKFQTYEMKKLLFLFFLLHTSGILHAQNSADTLKQEPVKANADDPSQFFTRIEVFNELQHYDRNGSDFYLNQTILRTIVKLGNYLRFLENSQYMHFISHPKMITNHNLAIFDKFLEKVFHKYSVETNFHLMIP